MSAFNGWPFRLMELQFFMVLFQAEIPGVPMRPTVWMLPALQRSHHRCDGVQNLLVFLPGCGMRIFSRTAPDDQE